MLTSSKKSIPGIVSPAVAEIERLGFSWTEEAQYDIGALSFDRRVQVRDSEHYAPKAQAKQYAVQMGLVQFPPIVISRNDWIIDGNTRIEAKNIRKDKFAHVLIVDADYTGKGTTNDRKMEALAATLNQQGGQRLTPSEARKAGRILSNLGWKPEQVARALGLKPGVVTQIKQELAAEAKFDRVGFSDKDKLGGGVFRFFGQNDALNLNDIPYKELVELSRDANLQVTELRDIVDEMKKTGSDALQITLLEQKRAAMSERITEHALTGNGKPPAASQLRRHLGYINGFQNNPNALIERVEDAMKGHLDALTTAITVLQAVLKEQEVLVNG